MKHILEKSYSPSIAVAGGETHEAVGQVVVADKRAELASQVRGVAHGTIPVSDNGLSDQGSEVVIILPANTLDSESNVGSGDSVITDSNLGADEIRDTLLLSCESRSGRSGRLAGERTEVLLSKLNELLVGDTARSNKDHAVSSVVGLDVVNKVIPLDAGNVLLGAEDGASKWLSLESSGVKVVEDNLFQLLVNLLLFAENHIPLSLNSGWLEFGVLEDIGQNVDSLGNVGVK